VFRAIWAWLDERTGVAAILTHPVPRENGWRGWMYVFGVATLTSFLVAVVTGIPIAMTYILGTGQAYQSIQWLDNVVTLGRQLRGLHAFSATAMLVLVGAHMIRVFLTGSFKYPRELNWLTGVALLFLTAGLLFTGQILRFDNFGLWTISIISFMTGRTPIIGDGLAHFLLGGHTFTGQTLSRFFALHVFVLPGLLLAIVGLHLYLILKVGISESPRTGRPVDPRTYRRWYEDLLKRDGVPYWPAAAWREAVAAFIVVVGIVTLTLVLGPPPLLGPPDPTHVVVQPEPDWYFQWYYAALALAPYELEEYLYVGGPLLLIIVLVLIPFVANRGERSPVRRPWAVASILMAGIMVLSLTGAGLVAPWSPRFFAKPLTARALPAAATPAVVRGSQVFYTASCIFCHNIYGQGGVRGPGLSNIGNELTSDELTIRILNGGYNMPAYASMLSPGQVHDLVAFLVAQKQYSSPRGPRVTGGQAAAP
jgi:ubiquinol-cytochrome c reductase cytochrome b subunit